MADYSTYTDYELATLLKQGDKTAFSEIYNRYDQPLYLYAYHKLGNKEDSRDVVQDVFTWLLNSYERVDLKTTLSGYLYKSVLNKVYNIYKKKQVIQKFVEQGDHFIDVERTETDFLIREKEIAAMIAKEIAAMPPRMREVYQLRSKHYMTAKQIAEHLNVAESTVITQLKRAMKHLRLKLGIVIYVLFILK